MNDQMQKPLTLSKPGDLMRFLEQNGKGAVAAALPKHMNPDRMLRVALTCFSTTPALRQCTAQSILASIVVASQLGLEPGVTGQGYLIPYGTTCTFVPGWSGMVGLLNNTGRATAWTGAVFEGDEWDFQLGSQPRCIHRPGENFGDPDKLEWVYACGKVNGSEVPIIEAWPMSRVWKHRDRFNKVGKQHYSYKHPEMYGRKVVLLQVLKYLPRSIEVNNAMVAANAAEMGQTVKVVEGVIEPEPGDIEVQTEGPKFEDKPAPTPRKKAPPTQLFDDQAPGAATKAEPQKEVVKPSQAIRNLAKASRMSEMSVLAYLERNGVKHSTLDLVPEPVLQKLAEQWPDLMQDIEQDLQPE